MREGSGTSGGRRGASAAGRLGWPMRRGTSGPGPASAVGHLQRICHTSIVTGVTRADTLATQAYQAIRLALLHGQLGPDVFYSENSVASMLGISRTPAREALRQLEIEGLIEVLPQRGFRVRRISAAELVEFYDLRGLLEAYVVRSLCESIDERSLRLLGHILERQEMAGGDVPAFLGLDEEFHLSMAQLDG